MNSALIYRASAMHVRPGEACSNRGFDLDVNKAAAQQVACELGCAAQHFRSSSVCGMAMCSCGQAHIERSPLEWRVCTVVHVDGAHVARCEVFVRTIVHGHDNGRGNGCRVFCAKGSEQIRMGRTCRGVSYTKAARYLWLEKDDDGW